MTDAGILVGGRGKVLALEDFANRDWRLGL
jgi:hypothetical protein